MLKIKRSPRTFVIWGIIIWLIVLICIVSFPNTSPLPESPITETGWKTEGDVTYYTLSDGSHATGLQEIDGKTYFFRTSGAMATGWQTVDGQPHYFLEDGQGASGALSIGGKLHHFTEGGTPPPAGLNTRARSSIWITPVWPIPGGRLLTVFLIVLTKQASPVPVGWKRMAKPTI